MIRWSLRSLMLEPARTSAGVVGIALALLLVIFFKAVFEGEAAKVVAYIQATDADVWVMQDGVSNMHMASSMLWDWKAQRVAEVDGVASVTPILYMNGMVRAGGRDWFSYIVGLRSTSDPGGPWVMRAGRARPGPGEAVIPATVARMAGLDLGDRVSIRDRDLEVVGLSEDTYSMANSITFLHWDDLEELMDISGGLSYLLVQAEGALVGDILARRIEAGVTKVNALSRERFAENDRLMALQMGTEIIRIMVLIGTVLATAIIAFTTYSQVAHQQREYALIKAVGFSRAGLLSASLLQASTLAVAGLLLATAIAMSLLPALPGMVPQLSILLQPEHLAGTALLAIPAALLGAALPAWRLGRLDPALIFDR